jgi:hypothetical protein
MEIEISRFWSDNNNAELLCKRPRIDYRISEYLFDFINQKILTDKKVMQSGNYSITLFMKLFDPEKHKFVFENPYNTDKTKFDFPGNRSFTSKTIYIFCDSLLFDSQMTPSEYTRIVYDMYAFYFIHRYKRLTKALFDETKKQLDYDFINSFEFPAPFENQKYSLDEITVEVNSKYDKDSRQWTGEFTFVPKDEYMKVFGK